MSRKREGITFINVGITNEQKFWLEQVSKKLEISMSWLIRRLISDRMKDDATKGNSSLLNGGNLDEWLKQ